MRPRPLTKPRCVPCRRKRTKCTYEKPSCAPCIRSGLVCQYQTNLVFVSYAATEDGSRQRHSNWLPAEDNAVIAARASSRQTTPSPIESIPLATVNRQALKDGFLRRYYPVKTDWWMSVCSWIFPALDGLNYTPLKVASTALGSAMMGTTINDDYQKQYSVQCYIKSMQQLRVRCVDARPGEWFKLLLTAILLLTFGTIHPMSMDVEGVTGHLVGIASILKVVGPSKFQLGDEHQAFLYARLLLLTQAIQIETPSFLSQPEWMTIPFTQQPKNNLHCSLDFIAPIPYFQQRLKQILLEPYSSSTTCVNSLVDNIETHSKKLDAFFVDICLSRPGVYESGSSRNFLDVGDSGTMIAYWSARMSLYDIVWRLVEADDSYSTDKALALLHSIETPAREAAAGSLSLVPYLTDPQQGIMGIGFVHGPLAFAARVYERLDDQDGLAACVAQLQHFPPPEIKLT